MRGSRSSSLRLLLLFSATSRTILRSSAFQSQHATSGVLGEKDLSSKATSAFQHLYNCNWYRRVTHKLNGAHHNFKESSPFGIARGMTSKSDVADAANNSSDGATVSSKLQSTAMNIVLCPKCRGEGKISKIPSKKERLRHQRRLYQREQELLQQQQQQREQGEEDNQDKHKRAKRSSSPGIDSKTAIQPMLRRWDPCPKCDQTGLRTSTGTGLDEKGTTKPSQKKERPVVAIVGGGIGGMALAVALKHRGIPFRVFEKDSRFDQRRQGYGLTLQQARRALQALGVFEADDDEKGNEANTSMSGRLLQEHAVTSTKHVVHTPDGKQVGEWGLRKWVGGETSTGACSEGRKPGSDEQSTSPEEPANDIHNTNCSAKTMKPRALRAKNKKRRQNLHVPRQVLRYALWESLKEAYRNEKNREEMKSQRFTADENDETFNVSWGHKLIDVDHATTPNGNQKVRLSFQVLDEEGKENEIVTSEADLVVGCDGIRSSIRQKLLESNSTPLRYLKCVVVLGICPLDDLVSQEVGASTGEQPASKLSPLLDGETVFQTADGTTRIYLMPYSKKNNEYMWQLSFPVEDEAVAKDLSRRGSKALKEEALKRCGSWHIPVPQILEATPLELVSGYPVYDRDILTLENLATCRERADAPILPVTLLGDAAHPMSPFKGQGANQALLDALSLARAIYRTMDPGRCNAEEKGTGFDISKAFEAYETEMLERSSEKVRASSEAARFLHTSIAIQEGNVTRGAAAAAAAAESS